MKLKIVLQNNNCWSFFLPFSLEIRVEEVMAAFDRKVTDFKPTVFMRSISTVAERLGFYKEEEIGKLFISPIPNQIKSRLFWRQSNTKNGDWNFVKIFETATKQPISWFIGLKLE